MYHLPFWSFFSKELYSDVAKNWKGVCFFYLFLLILICWIPRMIKLQVGISNITKNVVTDVISQIPDITIKKGKVSIDKPQPYNIIDPKTEKKIFVIDTTGKIKTIKETDAFCLLTADKIIVKKNKFETRSYDLDMIHDFTLTQKRINWWLDFIKSYLVIVLFPIVLFSSYIYTMIQVLIYAAIGLIFVSALKSNLTLKRKKWRYQA